MTHVVLEMGLCATDSGNQATVNMKSNVEVKDYKAVGDEDGFNDIEFN